MNQQQALKKLKQLANGRFHSIGMTTKYFETGLVEKEYNMFVRGIAYVYGTSYEQCLEKLGYHD